MYGYLGQEAPINPQLAERPEQTDSRGVIDYAQAKAYRGVRAREQWERIDSVVTGIGASNVQGWFETFQAMAAAEKLVWFAGRDPNVGSAYTNQDSERTDWAQDLYDISMQFIAPPGVGDLETNANDALVSQVLWHQLMSVLSLRIVLSESDEIAKAPADHFPAGFGTSYPLFADQSSSFSFFGNNGEPIVGNTWKFPVPIMLASKSRITIEGRIDRPLKNTLAGISGPGYKNIPTGFAPPNNFILQPNWFAIKATIRGPRYLQLRGARSSA